MGAEAGQHRLELGDGRGQALEGRPLGLGRRIEAAPGVTQELVLACLCVCLGLLGRLARLGLGGGQHRGRLLLGLVPHRGRPRLGLGHQSLGALLGVDHPAGGCVELLVGRPSGLHGVGSCLGAETLGFGTGLGLELLAFPGGDRPEVGGVLLGPLPQGAGGLLRLGPQLLDRLVGSAQDRSHLAAQPFEIVTGDRQTLGGHLRGHRLGGCLPGCLRSGGGPARPGGARCLLLGSPFRQRWLRPGGGMEVVHLSGYEAEERVHFVGVVAAPGDRELAARDVLR
ncbi:MAG: hypothetical protein JJLCMIEE_00377 [Acidimicrobiales bacterium]|nr:hypothetical protein [Acidimicrobiales bacterium]